MTNTERVMVFNMKNVLEKDISTSLKNCGMECSPELETYVINLLIRNAIHTMAKQDNDYAYEAGKVVIDDVARNCNIPVLTAEIINSLLFENGLNKRFAKCFRNSDSFFIGRKPSSDIYMSRNWVGLMVYLTMNKFYKRVEFKNSDNCTPMFFNPYYVK